MTSSNKTFYLAFASTLFALVVVVLGAYTRLVDAGLGCPDWPGCYGFLTVPESQADIAVAEARFPDAPVEVEKGWPEMVHRYFAGTLGLLILALAVISVRKRRAGNELHPFKLPLFLLVLVIWQALFGMWTVTLKLWPQVVTAHLLGGFATLSLLFLLSVRLYENKPMLAPTLAPVLSHLKPWALIGLAIAVLQIALGGWVSSNYAAYACTELPTCQEQWWPAMDFGAGFNFLQQVGPNYLGGTMDNEARVAIHMSHRIGALITLLYLAAFAFKLMRVGNSHSSNLVSQLGWLLLIVLAVQILLGLSNVVWHLPLPVAVAHNAGGALLLLSLVLINYYLITVSKQSNV